MVENLPAHLRGQHPASSHPGGEGLPDLHLRNLPDREAVHLVRENMYAQRFCGVSPAQVADYMHPASGLSNFRAKIGGRGMALIEEALTAAGQGSSRKREGSLILDTTCVPADILYPTDIRLLERCRQAVIRLLRKAKGLGIEYRIRAILHQQRLVRQGVVSIPSRIVSFHKDHVRPIVRGKFPLSTEFGPKVLFAIVRGCMYRVAAFQNNAADATLITSALRWFKERFGRLPDEVQGDRGSFARWRMRVLKAMGITPGLQQRGKAIEKSAAWRRMIRQRLVIEARISLGKRKFGWNRCRARAAAHETSWIGLGAAAMNAHLAFAAQPH